MKDATPRILAIDAILGMSITQDIVQKHKGLIETSHEPCSG